MIRIKAVFVKCDIVDVGICSFNGPWCGAYFYSCRLLFPMRATLPKALSFFVLNHLFSKWCSCTISAMVDKARKWKLRSSLLPTRTKTALTIGAVSEKLMPSLHRASRMLKVCLPSRMIWGIAIPGLMAVLPAFSLLTNNLKRISGFSFNLLDNLLAVNAKKSSSRGDYQKTGNEIGISRWVSIHIPD